MALIKLNAYIKMVQLNFQLYYNNTNRNTKKRLLKTVLSKQTGKIFLNQKIRIFYRQ